MELLNNRQIGLDDFFNWYDKNRDQLLLDSQKQKEINQKLREEFLQEWPINRLITMSLDDYVIGKGAQNSSFCYQLEQGKYKHLYMGIRGGAATKFGIYWSKTKNAYLDKVNKIITEDVLERQFNRLKSDLVEIITTGCSFQFNDPIFNHKVTQNSFYGRSAMIIKLLCIYDEKNSYFGVNNSKISFWEKMLPLETQGGIYKQNYQLVKKITEKYPEIDGAILGPILHQYYQLSEEDDMIMEEEIIESMYDKKIEMLLKSRNVIFRGAPGTGKTYLARQIAAKMLGCSVDELGNNPQFEFVQFHPNYDYSDFVEGLRPINIEDNIGFELKDGIFKAFCERAKKSGISLEGYKKYLEGANLSETKVQQYYNYIQFLLGEKEYSGSKQEIIPKFNNLEDIIKNSEKIKDFDRENDFHNYFLTSLNYLEKYFKEYINKPFIFLIDEINRGDISKIFGELFFSLDPNYRGKKGAISTQYANLHDTDEKFYIPENVYIIGTMNDIDRSVDSFDFAMRRRFRFVEIKASNRIDMLNDLGEKSYEAKIRLTNLNNAISNIESLDTNYHIGPAYFLKLNEVDYDVLWYDFIEPLLVEYLRGNYNAEDELERLKKAFEDTSEYGD